MTRTRIALSCALLVGCLDDPRLSDETQVFFSAGGTRAHVTLEDQGGFPDRVVEYEIVISSHGAAFPVRRARAQVQSISHQLSAEREGDELFIGLGDELCVVNLRGHSASWFHVREIGPRTSLSPHRVAALRWRARDSAADHNERAHAAIALSWFDPQVALAALEPLSLGSGNELATEAEATRARVTQDAEHLAELRERLPTMRGFEAIGLARACVPELADALAQWRTRRTGPTSLLDEAQAHCR